MRPLILSGLVLFSGHSFSKEHPHCVASEANRAGAQSASENIEVAPGCRGAIGPANQTCMVDRGNLEQTRQAVSRDTEAANRPRGTVALNRAQHAAFQDTRDRFLEFSQRCENQRAAVAQACKGDLDRLKQEIEANKKGREAAVAAVTEAQKKLTDAVRARNTADQEAAQLALTTATTEGGRLLREAPTLYLTLNKTQKASETAERAFFGATGCGVYQMRTYQASMDELDRELPRVASAGGGDDGPIGPTGVTPSSTTPRSIGEIAHDVSRKALDQAPELAARGLATLAENSSPASALLGKYAGAGLGKDPLASAGGTTAGVVARYLAPRLGFAATGVGLPILAAETFFSTVLRSDPAGGACSVRISLDPVVACNNGCGVCPQSAVQANESAIAILGGR